MSNEIVPYVSWHDPASDRIFLNALKRGYTWSRALKLSRYERTDVIERRKTDEVWNLAISQAEQIGADEAVDKMIDLALDGEEEQSVTVIRDSMGNVKQVEETKKKKSSIRGAMAFLKIKRPELLEKRVAVTVNNMREPTEDDAINARAALDRIIQIQQEKKDKVS